MRDKAVASAIVEREEMDRLLLVPRNKTTDARLDQRVLPTPGFAAVARNIRGNVNIGQGTRHWRSVCRVAFGIGRGQLWVRQRPGRHPDDMRPG